MAGKGAPKGNRYSVTHGLALVRNQIKKRVDHNRSYVDKRSHEGQDALKVQAGLVEDQGGIQFNHHSAIHSDSGVNQPVLSRRDDGSLKQEVSGQESADEESPSVSEDIQLPPAGHKLNREISRPARSG